MLLVYPISPGGNGYKIAAHELCSVLDTTKSLRLKYFTFTVSSKHEGLILQMGAM